ncbi:MAG: glycosyltransferase family 4 protein [Nocardioides sp.]
MTGGDAEPRVVLVVPSAQRTGGGDVWLEQVLPHLGAVLDQPTIVFESDGHLVRHAQASGWATEVLPAAEAAGGSPTHLVAPLADVLTRHAPDVTVFWSPRAQIYGAEAHVIAGRPGRAAWVQHVMPSTFWLHREASSQPTDVVMCVSHAVQQRQRELYPERSTRVVHPGVGESPSRTSRAGGSGSRARIGVVGRIEPWKGQDLAVRMLRVLEGRGTTAELWLIGQRRSPTWPEYGGEVEALADELGVTDRTRFTDHREDVPALLAELDLLICASREEGFGLAIVEAMAVGVPVVVTRCGGPVDIVEQGVNGLIVPPEDPDAMADAVDQLIRDRALAERLAGAAERTWRSRFTAQQSASSLLSLIDELADLSRS